MHTPIFGCAETTNTCPLDCEALALHVALCTRPAMLTQIRDIATGARVPANLSPAEQLVSTEIARAFLQFHDFFLARKFAAGRLVLVGCLLRCNIILYPTQLHQHIDLMADICLHILLTRMDKSFHQVDLDITAHCNSGADCDGELAEPCVERISFASIVGVNGPGLSFRTQILKTLLHPAISVPCDCAQALAREPQCRHQYDQAITAWQSQPNVAILCSSTANISHQLVEPTLPHLLTVLIRDPPAAHRHADAYHALPTIPATLDLPLPSGAHATYRLLNVARHNRTCHFDNVLTLPEGDLAASVRVRIDARETTRTMPCPPGSNPMEAYMGASAWYLLTNE